MNKIYIDSNCKICCSYGEFLKNRNSKIILSNQLELEKEEITIDELVYEKNNVKYFANEAIIESLYDLGGLFKYIKLLKVFPKSFSYFFYKIFSNNRYRFNKSEN